MEPKRILIGVDEGELARNALQAGIELARRFDAELELVHCIPLGTEPWVDVATIDWYSVRTDVLNERRARIRARLDEWFPGTEKAPWKEGLLILDGKPTRSLARHAAEKQHDLIVLGGHTKAGIFDFGGTARALLHHAPCAVWIQPEPLRDVRTILAPVDPNETPVELLSWLRTLGEAFRARIVLLYAHEPPAFAYEPFSGATATLPVQAIRDAARERFGKFVERVDWGDAIIEPRFVDGAPVAEILALEETVDLVAMGTHGRSAVGRAMLGSVAYGVLKAAHRPVLVVPMLESSVSP